MTIDLESSRANENASSGGVGLRRDRDPHHIPGADAAARTHAAALADWKRPNEPGGRAHQIRGTTR